MFDQHRASKCTTWHSLMGLKNVSIFISVEEFSKKFYLKIQRILFIKILLKIKKSLNPLKIIENY